ncbi:MAG: hypothetical protein N838_11470 [Thiohalocapsa sp. PB-PSB1]|jgi:hypothetical protein|nr:MAG: hypothetical protein N838_11470 [Thiohalocapsa sp. PB-PSB1]
MVELPLREGAAHPGPPTCFISSMLISGLSYLPVISRYRIAFRDRQSVRLLQSFVTL